MDVVLRFDAAGLDALKAFLRRGGFRFEDRPHAHFLARREGVTLTAYRSGKLLVTGAQAAEYAGVLVGEGLARGEVPVQAPRARTTEPVPGWVLAFDGCCMPRNPGGVAAYGYQVLRDGAIVHEGHGLAAPPGPGATNNVAEYRALVEGLRWLRDHGARSPLVRGDSSFVIETMTGAKTLRAPHLLPLRDEAQALAREIGARLEWVPREENEEADRLSRVGFDEAVREHPEWAR